MATKKLQTINIKGKNYVTVNERLKAFRETADYSGWTLQTIIHELTNDVAVFEAQILNKDGKLIANGFAREIRTGGGVNATSYVENCETSAWGRALGNLGIGIDDSICSANELLIALDTEKNAPAAPKSQSNVIYPKKEEKPAESKIMRVELTDREKNELDDACAQMDFAQDINQLYSIAERYKEARFFDIICAHGSNIIKNKKWISKKVS